MSSKNGSGNPLLTPLLPEVHPLHRRHKGKGQRVSNERGAHTRSKKNPGKRAHLGGS